MEKQKRGLSLSKLIPIVKEALENTKELFKEKMDSRGRKAQWNIVDYIMSGLAIFGLKYPSLLQFDMKTRTLHPIRKSKLKLLFGIETPPSDTQLRAILDGVEQSSLIRPFKAVFEQFQEREFFEEYVYYKGHMLLAIDGTGMIASKKIKCETCNTTKDEYCHHMEMGVFMCPDKKQVLPICPEPIAKRKRNDKKNDCEQEAAKRLLRKFRNEWPELKVIVVADALTANAPYVGLLKELNLKFINGIKPDGNNKSLFEWIEGLTLETCEFIVGKEHWTIEFKNNLPINEDNKDLEVNFLKCTVEKEKSIKTFTWMTDIDITEENAATLVKIGRARWKVENETFNTLKNYGYNFEHNFGHGAKNLCHVLGTLMVLAFLMDQIQEFTSETFQAAKKALGCRRELWGTIRAVFTIFRFNSWEELYYVLIENFAYDTA